MSDQAPAQFGRFRVVSELGRGAMGVVYRAEDTTLGRLVAIKTIALAGSSREERDQHEARFLQEARAAARISHAAVITIYEMGREGDVAFIAMELLDGVDLRSLIRTASLTPSQAFTIAATVAEGLACAHEQGIVHRDVKPGNIMVLPDGRVKIMDFGIARPHEPTVKTQTGLLLGSPQYMSPEQIVGRPIDHRADVFSLGLVLYEMLTGVRPFAGEDIPELTFKVANMPATPPSHVVEGMPPIVDMIVARALKKNADERYASAADFARDLWAAIPEVRAAEAARLARASATTTPLTATGRTSAPQTDARPLAMREESIALRPSPRFDSSAALARLPVVAADGELASTHVDGTVPLRPTLLRRIDPDRAAAAVAYAVAALAAAAIALG